MTNDVAYNWNFVEMWIHDNYLTSVQIPKNPVLDLKLIPLLRSFILSLLVWTWKNWFLFFFSFFLPSSRKCTRKVYFIFTFFIEKIIRYLWHSAQFSHIHKGSHHNSNKHDFFSQIGVEILLNRIMKNYIKSQNGASPCHSWGFNAVGLFSQTQCSSNVSSWVEDIIHSYGRTHKSEQFLRLNILSLLMTCVFVCIWFYRYTHTHTIIDTYM